MALYRYQVTSVSLWRGKVKRFNNTFHAVSPGYVPTLKTAMDKVGFKEDGDVLGDCSGGVASISVYNALGGPPISQTVYFDWAAPATWIPYVGSAWASVPAGTPVDASGESALIWYARLPGVSATGKPMSIRKYLHAVPSRSTQNYSDPDISLADQALLKVAFPSSLMYSPRGVAAGTPNVEPYYGNHQRVRGRRRTTAAVAAQAFSFGVLAGGGATTSGQGTPFPGGEF